MSLFPTPPLGRNTFVLDYDIDPHVHVCDVQYSFDIRACYPTSPNFPETCPFAIHVLSKDLINIANQEFWMLTSTFSSCPFPSPSLGLMLGLPSSPTSVPVYGSPYLPFFFQIRSCQFLVYTLPKHSLRCLNLNPPPSLCFFFFFLFRSCLQFEFCYLPNWTQLDSSFSPQSSSGPGHGCHIISLALNGPSTPDPSFVLGVCGGTNPIPPSRMLCIFSRPFSSQWLCVS